MPCALNLYGRLEAEWSRLGRTPDAHRRLALWAAAEPDLRGFDTPADVVDRCQRRGDPLGSNRLLRALLGQAATDDLAARAVLQAVLPGLAAIAGRCRRDSRPGGPWQGMGHVDQEVVVLALEAIGDLAECPPPWPATAICDRTWRRMRTLAAAHRRRANLTAPLEEGEHVLAGPARPAAEMLTLTLADAVTRGVVTVPHAQLVYMTRVLGHEPEELAAAVGYSRWWAYKTRARTERRLAEWEGVLPSRLIGRGEDTLAESLDGDRREPRAASGSACA